jgi:ribonucleotide monophosphatase NagD (HAD superfamily)
MMVRDTMETDIRGAIEIGIHAFQTTSGNDTRKKALPDGPPPLSHPA